MMKSARTSSLRRRIARELKELESDAVRFDIGGPYFCKAALVERLQTRLARLTA